VLIWGAVHHIGGQTAPRFYWTTSQESKHAKATNDVYVIQSNAFKLPDLFWTDLAEVLRLVVATQHSTFLAREGHYVADQLPPFITRVRRLLNNNAGRQEWSDIQVVLGTALVTFGEQTGTNQPLEEAVAAYRAALTEWTRERVPLDWATTQNNLGNALSTLGERTKDAVLLCEALEKQLIAWEVFAKSSPYYTSIAVNNAKNTIATLKNTLDVSTAETCIARQQKQLKRMGVL
jgi:hypothetical protein